jgi:NHL repeat.
VAGGSYVGDGGLAANALLVQPAGIAVDAGGNVYIADAAENRVRRSAPGGVITTLAGTGVGGYGADGIPAAAASLNAPYGLCADRYGNIYIADLGNRRVRRVGRDGIITTIAGGGTNPPDDGMQATDVQLAAPRNVALDAQNNLYISDFNAHQVYRVSPSGRIALIAGSGASGFSGDGASAVGQSFPIRRVWRWIPRVCSTSPTVGTNACAACIRG